ATNPKRPATNTVGHPRLVGDAPLLVAARKPEPVVLGVRHVAPSGYAHRSPLVISNYCARGNVHVPCGFAYRGGNVLTYLRAWLDTRVRSERGASAVEYALVLAGVAAVLIGV